VTHADFVPLGSAKNGIQPIAATPYDRKGKMTLGAAIRAGDLAAATDLVRSGMDVDCFTPEGLAPLMIASGLGHSRMVDLLLTAGAQVLAVEPRAGATALHKAALSGTSDVVGLLLDHGAFIDQLAGYEAMAMIRKGQLRNIGGRDMRAQASFIAELFENAA
jgi:ankyrin repeat protein